jgi:hypothetical protein
MRDSEYCQGVVGRTTARRIGWRGPGCESQPATWSGVSDCPTSRRSLASGEGGSPPRADSRLGRCGSGFGLPSRRTRLLVFEDMGSILSIGPSPAWGRGCCGLRPRRRRGRGRPAEPEVGAFSQNDRGLTIPAERAGG